MQYFDLSHFSILKVSGDDAHDFLNAQITCDLNELDMREWLFAGWCQPNGRVISTFIIFKKDGDYFLVLPSMLRDQVRQRLTMYILRSSVKINDSSDDITLLGLTGENSPSIVDKICSEHALTVLRMWDKNARFFLFCPNDIVSEIMNHLVNQCQEGDRSGWSLLDIEAGMPWIINATSGLFLPQMLNLDQFAGLSYRKGCFPGQEVIARLHYRGQLKKRLFLGRADARITPGAGDRIETPDHEYAGDIIDAERHPDGGVRFLAVIELSRATSDKLSIKGNHSTPIDVSTIHYPYQ